MSSVIISGDTSGAVTIAAPAVAGTNTLTLQAGTATNSMNTLATAVATTSGTSIGFTGIPSWIKRLTVMMTAVSTSGASLVQVQIGATTYTTSGYASSASTNGANATSTTGFLTSTNAVSTDIRTGIMTITNISGNIWVMGASIGLTTVNCSTSAGVVTLGGTLDRVRITTVNGTDTFDGGSINILYE